MKKIYIYSLSLGIMATACKSPTNSNQTNGINLNNLDTTFSPQNDFYDYATGGWQKNNPLKPEYARFGSFDQLRETNKEQLRTLVDDIVSTQHQKGSIDQKIADFYTIGLDSTRLNNEGLSPLKEQMDVIAHLNDKSELGSLLGNLHRHGISSFFIPYVDADAKNSSINLFQTYQGGLGLEERDYYLDDDAQMVSIRNAYEKYVAQLFGLAGEDEASAKSKAKRVIDLETELAKAQFTQADLRDPVKNYNKISLDELTQSFHSLNWNDYFNALQLKQISAVSLSQLSYMQKVDALLASLSLDDIKTYMTFHLLNTAAPYLSDSFVDAQFNFYGKILSGKQEQQPRWKRVLSTTDDALGEAIGQLYVKKYFPEEAKQRMIQLVNNLQVALGERINQLSWMSDVTKKAAIEKLNAFTVKIGYPDKWRDYSNLNIESVDSYWDCVQKSQTFNWDFEAAQNEKAVDKAKWHMSPQTVNAYYNPSSNEICFPAAILQPPFFYLDGDDATNYGGIGVVIGHEMTHGFDDQGRQFDKDGNVNDWWQAEDAKLFNEKTAILVNQFDSIRVLGETCANGRFTLGENIADQGGLLVSFQALQNALKQNPSEDPMTDNFTREQRFYLAYATLWAGNIRDEEILRLTKIDPHSLSRWRVNGTLPNIQSFYEAFDIKPNDGMYKPEEERVVIW